MDDEETVEEGRVIVDNLNAQGITLKRPYRLALYRMYARALGYFGKREILPHCVYNYIDATLC